ncbi:MAG: DUF4838 domain-containing protein [Armatimonadota bacterium]
MRSFFCILGLLACLGLFIPAGAAPRYRDLAVYTTSAPAAETIVAKTQFVNRGRTPLKLAATLQPSPWIGFPGAQFTATVAPGKTAEWTWSFTPQKTLTRQILFGDIRINGKVERDLFISVQGPDPAVEVKPGPVTTATDHAVPIFGPDTTAFQDRPEDRITEAARVTATYAPRTPASIQAELQARKAPKPVLTLAAQGKTEYAIVLESLPDAAQTELADAVKDLQRCVKLQSGAELPLAATPAGPAIRLRLVKMQARRLHDAYHLFTKGKDVIIEAGNAAGLRNGIYGLLADHLDCRWFQPRGLGEEITIPKDKTVRLPALDETRGSTWFSTSGASWGAERLWDRRNRAFIGGGRMNFGHSWHSLINKAEFPYEKFPDYYARDREGKIRLNDMGWTWTNLCSTNPDVIDIVAKKTNDYFAKHPDAIVAAIDPNDYGLMCLCDRCLALDKHYGQTKEDGTEVADRLLHFSKEVYNRLDPKYKDRFLGILVYANQREVPVSAKPHDHHAGIICDFPLHYDHSRPWNDPTSPRNAEFFRQVKGWGKLLKQYGYYDYYGHWQFFGPWAMTHKMREDLPAFHELGGTFLVLENQPNFAIQGLNHYISARLIWDVDADVDLLLEEYFQRYYGPAAGPMRKFWLTAERYYALERPGIMTNALVAQRPEFWIELEGCLAEAEGIIAKLPAGQKRYIDRVRQVHDAFQFAYILHQYDSRFGELARRNGVAIDHKRAVQFLQRNRKPLEEIQARYPVDDPYWPLLVASYFRVNVDAMLKEHQK